MNSSLVYDSGVWLYRNIASELRPLMLSADIDNIYLVGSARRLDTILFNGIDILIISDEVEISRYVKSILEDAGFELTGYNPSVIRANSPAGIPIKFFFYTSDLEGLGLLYTTGPSEFILELNSYLLLRGSYISQNGILNYEGSLTTESDIFDWIGIPFIPPQDRLDYKFNKII